MSQRIQIKVSIQIAGGPKLESLRSLEVEAYDSIQIIVAGEPNADTNKEVELQPASSSGQVKFLAITANRYSNDLTYRVNDKNNPEVTLDQPHVLTGQGAVGLLDTAPTKLFFSSKLDGDTAVEMLVGRDATP